MMRHGRRGSLRQEFGGSGEDSFVAVVVTKLTGALLFILLLTMVIMALIPRADGVRRTDDGGPTERPPLSITTPEALPEAIAGRPYSLALAATGGSGPLRWRIDGPLPEGLALEPSTGLLHGTPIRGTPEPSELVLSVSDGSDRASRPARLVVYQPEKSLALASRWKPALPPVPWHAWMQQGFGFLVLLLVHLVGLHTLSSLERGRPEAHRRFRAYRVVVWLASLGAVVALAVWLVVQRTS